MSEYSARALQEIRDQLRHDDHYDPQAIREAFAVLEEAGVFEETDRWLRRHGWLPVPAHVEGKQVRHRAIVGQVRLGGDELYMIAVETDEWVIVKPWNREGTKAYPSKAYPLAEFNQKYERKEQP